ncbi:hypothetical protein [Paraburkholderia oxyphila]|uniref:hypothetical protein n=1 Tax=Paraburkholderia oxyphila TaxID=614212 RepID=UPI000693F63E|nr:hypothetical protein [Paraburkholderia oxyphila]
MQILDLIGRLSRDPLAFDLDLAPKRLKHACRRSKQGCVVDHVLLHPQQYAGADTDYPVWSQLALLLANLATIMKFAQHLVRPGVRYKLVWLAVVVPIVTRSLAAVRILFSRPAGHRLDPILSTNVASHDDKLRFALSAVTFPNDASNLTPTSLALAGAVERLRTCAKELFVRFVDSYEMFLPVWGRSHVLKNVTTMDIAAPLNHRCLRR